MSATEPKSAPPELPNRERFFQVYREELTAAVLSRPRDYLYDIGHVPEVVMRMEAAIIKGSFSKDSAAFRQTCRRLGIRHTYQAMKEVIDRA